MSAPPDPAYDDGYATGYADAYADAGLAARDPRPTASIRAYQPDWDSYGALAPCPTACDRADAWVVVLRSLGASSVTVCPLPSGAVCVEWSGPAHEGAVDLLPEAS